MSSEDLELARRFLSTLATVANTGERELLYPFLASDVEWVTPRRALTGIDEVREQLTWLTEPVSFDLEFEANGDAGSRPRQDRHQRSRDIPAQDDG